jgi:hypothetical protein
MRKQIPRQMKKGNENITQNIVKQSQKYLEGNESELLQHM